MNDLSIFVDESGDFGPYEKHSPYYIVTLVFHDQSHSIKDEVFKPDQELIRCGLPNATVHTEPLIRREEDYANLSPNERRAIFSKLFFFTMRAEISYKVFVYEKKQFSDTEMLESRIHRDITRFLRENMIWFSQYHRVILYYDNGQHQLNRILNAAIQAEITHSEIRRVLPADYRLFQSADLICTLTLLGRKMESHSLTHSELLLFHSPKQLKKDFLKRIATKSFEQ